MTFEISIIKLKNKIKFGIQPKIKTRIKKS